MYKDLILDVTTAVFTEIDSLLDTNSYKVKIILVDSTNILPNNFLVSGDLRDMPGKDFSLVQIQPVNPLNSADGYGNLIFFRYDSGVDQFIEEGRAEYVGIASVYAAIYAESFDTYQCGMIKAFSRLGILSDIYRTRTDELVNHFVTNPDPQNCRQKLSDAKIIIDNIFGIGGYLTPGSMNTLFVNLNQLKTDNRNIQRHSCPVIY